MKWWLLLLFWAWPGWAWAGFCAACTRPSLLATDRDHHTASVLLPLVLSQTHAGPVGGAQVTIAELDAVLSLRLWHRWSFDLVLPLRWRAIDAGRSDLQSERHFGFGDAQLTSRYRWLDVTAGDGFSLETRAGLGLPFGGTRARPLAGATVLPFGQQVLQAVVGGQATWQLDGARVLAFAWAKLPLYRSATGYQAGARASVGGAYLFDYEQWGLELGGGFYGEAPDRFGDGPALPTTGHRDLFLRVGLRIFQASDWPAELALVLPLTLSSEDPDALHSPGTISFSVGRDFRL